MAGAARAVQALNDDLQELNGALFEGGTRLKRIGRLADPREEDVGAGAQIDGSRGLVAPALGKALDELGDVHHGPKSLQASHRGAHVVGHLIDARHLGID